MRILKRWDGGRWIHERAYWRLIRHKHPKHRLHGQYRWYWGRYRRIGVHFCRLRILRRFWHDRWRHVRSYWHLWRRNHYHKRPQWRWGRYRRVGRHLYRLRVLYR